MNIDLVTILSLVNEIESEDPIDWAMLRIDETVATELIANQILDLYNQDWVKLNDCDRTHAMLAMITKLVVENFTLNVKLHR